MTDATVTPPPPTKDMYVACVFGTSGNITNPKEKFLLQKEKISSVFFLKIPKNVFLAKKVKEI